MSGIWIIASNDLRVFLKEKWGYVWLFAMPLLFIYFFGIAMRGNGDDPANPRPAVAIENDDVGYAGDLFVELIEAEGLRVVDSDQDDPPDRLIRIPADFTQKIESAEHTDIEFKKDADSSAEPAAMLEVRVGRAIVAMTSAIVRLVASDPGNVLNQANLREQLAKEKHVVLNANFAGRLKAPSGFEQSVPGYTVMFVLMNLLLFGGLSISQERTNGVLRRLWMMPVGRGQIVVGKILGRFLLGVIQIFVMLLFSRLVFGVEYGPNTWLVAVTLCVFAWGCASLGVFVGSVIRDPESVQGICTLGAVAMAALGGCWWPLEVVPDFARRIGYLFPTAWAMDAMHQLISFGGGLPEIWFPLSLIAVFATASTILAVKFLRLS